MSHNPRGSRSSMLGLSLNHGFRDSHKIMDPPSPGLTTIEESFRAMSDMRAKVADFVDGKVAAGISAAATIISLLAYDFTIAFLPKEVDTSTDVILLLCFIWFTLEILANVVTKKTYVTSFWFLLDLVATISLIPDISMLLILFGTNPEDVNLSQARAGRAGKSARSSVALKAVRMIRFSRLLRVVRVFRFFSTGDPIDDEKPYDPVDTGSSRIGQDLTESVTKKVIGLVLLLVVVLPWLDPSEGSFAVAVENSLQMFDHAVQNGADARTTLDLFKTGVQSPLLYASHNSSGVLVNDVGVLSSRRSLEKFTLETSVSHVIFDNRQFVFEEAGLGLILTLFALVIFALATTCINSSAMALVVEPISQMVHVMLHMAGVIGLLGGASSVEKVLEESNEIHLVEVLCSRVSDIFSGGSTSSKAPGNPSKAMSLMAMKKVTKINTGDRVIEIDVSEKRGVSIEQEVREAFARFRQNHQEEDNVDVENIKEFDTLEQLVTNPVTQYCLHMFMTSNLTVNNLIFYHRAKSFQDKMRTDFGQLHRQFIDDASPAQINLDAADFKALDKVLAGESNVSEHTFDKAIDETWKLMEDNIFKQFKQSVYAQFYVWMKENDPHTINHLQMTDVIVEA